MQFEIKTSKLNEMLTKITKGVGNNKLLPITSFIHIKLDKKSLRITATDINNYITSIENNVVGKSGEMVVPADQFIKLLSKTTSGIVKFEKGDDVVVVKGNGNYKIPLLNEKFPTFTFSTKTPEVVIKSKVLKSVFAINKASLATDMSMPCLTGYYVGDMATTTDGVKMCMNNVKLFDEPVLLTQELAVLMNSVTSEDIKVQHNDGKLLFTTDNLVIFGAELEGLTDYPDLSHILEFEYPSKCKISKPAIASILDRLGLFVSPYDKNGIQLYFTKDGLLFSDLNDGGAELTPYLESENFTDFQCQLNIVLLQDQISAIQSDSFELHYGNDIAIKLVDGEVNQILCRMREDEEAEEQTTETEGGEVDGEE